MENINPLSVGQFLNALLEENFGHYERKLEPTSSEKMIANELFVKFAKITSEYEFIEENVNTLGVRNQSKPDGKMDASNTGQIGDPNTTENHLNWSSEDQSQSTASIKLRNGSITQRLDDDNKENDPDYKPSVTVYKKPSVSIKTKAKILALWAKHPTWSFETIKSKYPAFAHRKYKKEWEQQILNGGTRDEIFFEIDKYMLKMFIEARNESKAVHDMDLRKWALQRAVEFPGVRKTFKASHDWINRFKKRHNITSRKVTKLVSKRNLRAIEEILENVEKFRLEVQDLQAQYDLSEIVNSDQIGINYEYVDTRSLSYKGEKITFGSGFSPRNRVTHSHTGEYSVSAAGKLLTPAFVCLQEASGRLGDRVLASLFRAPNICVSCSKSGKMTGTMVKYFFDNCIKPNIKCKMLYILDSWGAHVNSEAYNDVGKGNKIEIKIIPKNGTPYAQPLDVYFNRQLKYFIKRFKSFANLIDRDTGSRNDTLNMHSLAHFLLSAPCFEEMIRYSWLKSGLVKYEKREYFLNMRDACFDFSETECEFMECLETTFIRCSWCKTVMCFACFFDKKHQFRCKKGPDYLRNYDNAD